MKSEELLRAILPDVLVDNFEVVRYEKTEVRFDIILFFRFDCLQQINA